MIANINHGIADLMIPIGHDSCVLTLYNGCILNHEYVSMPEVITIKYENDSCEYITFPIGDYNIYNIIVFDKIEYNSSVMIIYNEYYQNISFASPISLIPPSLGRKFAIEFPVCSRIKKILGFENVSTSEYKRTYIGSTLIYPDVENVYYITIGKSVIGKITNGNISHMDKSIRINNNVKVVVRNNEGKQVDINGRLLFHWREKPTHEPYICKEE